MSSTSNSKMLLAGAALAIAAVVFFIRVRPGAGAWQWDFAIYSAASRAWIEGRNPYDHADLYARWGAESEQGAGMMQDISWLQSIVPPTTLAVLSPVAALPRRAAFWSWFALNCAAVAASVIALIQLARSDSSGRWIALLPAWTLLLGPVQSGVSAGQPAIAATALIVLAIWCETNRRPVLSGALLGVAMALKLQLAAPFLLYYLLTSRWRVAAMAVLCFATIAAVALLRLQIAHVPWLHDWLQNIRQASSNGGPNDFVTTNPNHDHLVNLQAPFYAIFDSRAIAHVLTAIVVGSLSLLYLWQLRSRDTRQTALTRIAPLAALTLLPVYHRYYDASLLIIPLAWALARAHDKCGRIALAMMLPFCFPVGWAMNLVRKAYVSSDIASQPWWKLAVMPMMAWLTLGLAVILIGNLLRQRTAAQPHVD